MPTRPAGSISSVPNPSTSLIVVFFFLFFPAAFIMLFCKLYHNRRAGRGNPIVYYIWGGLFLGYMLILYSSVPYMFYNPFILCFLFIGGGFIYHGLKLSKIKKRYFKYYEMINVRKICSIQSLADELNLNYATAVEDLKKIIDYKFLDCIYIDMNIGEVVFAPYGAMPPRTAPVNPYMQNVPPRRPEPPKPVVITCNGCGAKNTVYAGKANQCEFCGSEIG